MTKKYDPSFPDRYHRQSTRQPDHHYDWPATYFITICAEHRECLFDVPALRDILQQTWVALPKRFPGVILDEFVIMPNHVHLIVRLSSEMPKPLPLWQIIGAYKSITTVAWLHHIKDTTTEYPGIIWQDRYHDHCIRNASELAAIRKYIRDNPSNWNPGADPWNGGMQ